MILTSQLRQCPKPPAWCWVGLWTLLLIMLMTYFLSLPKIGNKRVQLNVTEKLIRRHSTSYNIIDVQRKRQMALRRSCENQKRQQQLQQKQQPHQQQKQQQQLKKVQRHSQPEQEATFRPGRFKYIFVDDSRRYLYCLTQKVASTNWKRTLGVLTGNLGPQRLSILDRSLGLDRNPSGWVHNVSLYNTLGIKRLNQYSREEMEYRLDHYFKFLFVRHPLRRLVSTFRDKFTLHDRNTKIMQKQYGRKIIAKYRKNPSKLALERGHDVRFEEFIEYLADTPLQEVFFKFNGHWQTFSNLCSPCNVHYDFVGHLETLEEDAKYVLSHIAPESDNDRYSSVFPDAMLGPTSQRYKYTLSLKQMFANISMSTLAKLLTIYSVDFDMFGYSPLSDEAENGQ